MNTLPEWFTVKPEGKYTVRNLAAGRTQSLTGRQLRDGLPVELKPGDSLRLLVMPE